MSAVKVDNDEAASSRMRTSRSDPDAGSEAARRELVRRIVHSPTFIRSERLGTLLTYVCDMSLKGRDAEINEQKLGFEVFGRSKDYDSSIDGIVRSQASRLRRRLDEYFEREGADEPVRILIPRGGYVPVFQPKALPEPPPPVSLPAEVPTPIPLVMSDSGASRSSRSLAWGVSLALALLLAALWVHDRRRQAPAAIAVTHPFWSHIFEEGRPALVVAPDSGLVLFHGMSGREIGLKEYIEAGYRTEPSGMRSAYPAAPQKDWLLDVANRRYTSIVDVQAILNLKDRARSLGSDVSLRYARDLRPNDFKGATVILLGMSSANPWVELFESDMNFVLKDDFRANFGVVNRKPEKGEPAQWQALKSDPQKRVFGVVAYVPNLEHNGNTLLIEGISMSGTEAAMDFVNDDAQLLPFLDRIRRPDGTLPYFEILLESHSMGASAVRSQILAWRTK